MHSWMHFSSIPLKVAVAGLVHLVVVHPQGLDHASLDLCRAHHVELRQEVVGHGHQGLTRPRSEPVHGAAGYQPWELQRAGAEFLPNLPRWRREEMS